MSSLHGVLALLASLAGVGCLFGAWCRRIPRHWHPLPAGWGLLIASGALWVVAAGAEFGIALVLLVAPLTAWGFVIVNRSRRPRRLRPDAPVPRSSAGGRGWSTHGLLFLAAVPVAGVASVLVTVAMSLALPVRPVNAMVTVMAVVPLLWGCAAYWACADPQPLRPAAVLTLGAVASAAVIYV